MNREYFTDNLSVEDIAEMTDKMLKFEKNAKNGAIKSNLLKIIPAVAALLLVIGLINAINLLPLVHIGGGDTAITPGAVFAAKHGEVSGTELTIIPKIIEKETFDSLMASIPENSVRIFDKFHAYYGLLDDSVYSYDDLGLKNPVYILDLLASEREIAQLLGYWNSYIGWTDEDYCNMLEYYGLFEAEENALIISKSYTEAEAAKKSTFNNKATILDGYEITIIGGDNWSSVVEYKDHFNTAINCSEVTIHGEAVIGLPNYAILNVPDNTVISGKSDDGTDAVKITIGDGDAVITGPDSSKTVKQNTVLDGEGNVIE